MKTAVRLVLAALMPALVSAAPPRAQVPPRDARPPSQQAAAVGSAVISGTVLMAGGTQPARKVRLSLSGAEVRGGRTATTDDQGRYSFTALPAGRYTLTATKPGHVAVTYGQRRPGRAGTPIQLSDGQTFRADLQIPKGSVITGTVFDENGEPSPQTQVRVMRVIMQNGRRTLQGSNSSSTDDRGIYRAFGLLPGDYVVCATPRNSNLGDFARMATEVRALQQSLEAMARVSEEQARVVGQRIASLEASMPPDDDTAPPGYAPICYPGSISAATASSVTLGISEERPGIDFQLQLAPLARIEGTVVNSTGAQVREINVQLTDAQPAGLSLGNMSARADSEGRFRLMNVPPGQYRLTARAMIQPARAPQPPVPPGGGRGRGAAPPVPREDAIAVWGSADVSVDGRTLSNVLLTLQQGVSVSGQVTFEGAATPPADLTRLRVTMSPFEPTPFGGSSSARVDASGRFTIPSVVPGRYRLAASAPGGWVTESAVIGGQDALDFPYDVKGNQSVTGVVVTFTDRPTELSGTVTDDKNQPAPGYTLIVFPADSRYWTGSSRRIQSTRPSTDGRFTFRNLPPGDYRLAPVADLEPGQTSDPTFLQQLEATALRVSLQPGEKKTQDMRLSVS
ncbi:MAG TPA: carboxypeptidase regulatory-like domain-containing protein [Vicinamibacterales bacterium]|nr:carboxypeptidase regulatory-like domain-containing protein [Vicinamibacterales bacterium]